MKSLQTNSKITFPCTTARVFVQYTKHNMEKRKYVRYQLFIYIYLLFLYYKQNKFKCQQVWKIT